MNQCNVIQFLSKFTELSDEEKYDLCIHIETRIVPKNQIILKEGSPCDKFGLLVKGAVRFYKKLDNGKEQTLGFGFENRPLMEFKSIDEVKESKLNLQTIEDCHIEYIRFENFLSFIQKHPRFYTVYIEAMNEFVDKMNHINEILLINSVRERYDKMYEFKPDFFSRVPLSQLASFLRIAPGTLSKLRAGKF